MMIDARIIILEGSHGYSFFFRETLLAQGLAKCVDLVSQAEQAIDLIQHAHPYDLVIIDLTESWEEGMQFGFWLYQYAASYPVMLIVPPDMARHSLAVGPFSVVSKPLSLRDFTELARTMLLSNRADLLQT